MTRLLCFALCLMACACAHEKKDDAVYLEINHESDFPARLEAPGRRIEVDLVDRGTVLHIGDATVTCTGHHGALGRLGTEAGWVLIGRLNLAWDGQQLRLRSRKRWGTITLSASTNLVIDQNGEVADSIFKP